MMTKLIIYLLAMLTGFADADSARPVSAVPASVGAEASRLYAAVAVKVVEQRQDQPTIGVPASSSTPTVSFVVPAFTAIAATTPILRHDVILA